MKTKNLFPNIGLSLCLLLCFSLGHSNSATDLPFTLNSSKADSKKNSYTFHPISSPPTVSIVSPADGAFFTVGSTIAIAATATDSDGFVASVEFFADGISLGIDNTAPYEAAYTITSGSHILTAIATDNTGLSTTSVAVNLHGGTHYPVVSITSPANNSYFSSGTIVTITANASDPDGTISSVEFFVDGISLGSATSVPYQINYTSTSGTHELRAKATDNTGATTTSSSVNIVVHGPTGYGLKNIIVEKYYVSNAADAAQADADIDQYNMDNGTNIPHGALPVGSVTYRFYADLSPGYHLLAVYADQTKNHPLKFTSTSFFYNHPLGSLSPLPGTPKSAIKNNLLALDSYFTFGAVATGQYGILKTEDNGVANNITTSGNPSGVLLHTDPSIGIPLTTQDGLIAGSGLVTPSFVGFSASNTDALNDGTASTNLFDLNDGSMYTTSHSVTPVSGTTKILIAQITTRGSLHYEFNLLLQNGTGPGEYFVAKNAGQNEFSFPFMSGDLINDSANIAPIVSISSPANDATIQIGETVLITANASHPFATIDTVEFFVDGISAGIDHTFPFDVNYTVTSGLHVLRAKATSSNGKQALSNGVSISGVTSIPKISITSPLDFSTHNVNTNISFVATASDSLGTIDSVQFFVDGILIGVDKSSPYEIPYFTTIGNHQLIAKAFNNQGIAGTSMVTTITVINPVNTGNGLERIYVEKYYVSNAADAAQADLESVNHGFPTGALPAGSVTYRFYADLLPDYKLRSVYADGVKKQPLLFKTSTSFYNHPLGQITPVPGTTKSGLKNSLLALDSYVTFGGVANGQFGIPKTEDDETLNNVTTSDNPAGVLLNNAPYMIHPLTFRDGMIPGSGVTNPSINDFSSSAIAAFSDGSTLSNEMIVIDGSIYSPVGATGPISGSNKVLIAQVTTNGVLDYELYLVIQKSDGTVEYYAAHPGNENFIPSLLGTLEPNGKPYGVKTTENVCTTPGFCLPIIAKENVKDVIGYDIVLGYDKTKVHPTGNVSISNVLINTAYASYVTHDNSAAGELKISVFLNANAPDFTTFNGLGELLCVEFTKDPSLGGTESTPFKIISLQESYLNGVNTIPSDSGLFTNQQNTLFTGSLKFWTDQSPIRYNANDPSVFLITKIYGTDANCINTSGSFTYPDLNGNFTYNVTSGLSVNISRDINNWVDVQPVINGFDASLGHKVLINDLSFVPSIYQMIALDINTDGVISAGDISQLNQRSVKTIPEFKQKWNYNNSGNSNGQPSKDWLFVNDSLLINPAYKISSTYPSNDGTGYSKYKVPVVPFCLKLPTAHGSCNTYDPTAYTGILLGDVNGNYDMIPADGQIKRLAQANNGAIHFNLDKAISGINYLDIPVSFTSSQKIVSLDFALQFNKKTVGFNKVVSSATYLNDALANFANDDQTLRFTSNSNQEYKEGETVTTMRFSTKDGLLNTQDFYNMIGYLNGEPVQLLTKGAVTTGISSSAQKQVVDAYPNPANHTLNVLSTEKVTLVLMDLQGRLVGESMFLNAGEKQEISTIHIANGTYILKVFNDHFVSTQRIVIEHIR